MKAAPAAKTCVNAGQRTSGINAWATCSACGTLQQVDRRSGKIVPHGRKGERAR